MRMLLSCMYFLSYMDWEVYYQQIFLVNICNKKLKHFIFYSCFLRVYLGKSWCHCTTVSFCTVQFITGTVILLVTNWCEEEIVNLEKEVFFMAQRWFTHINHCQAGVILVFFCGFRHINLS